MATQAPVGLHQIASINSTLRARIVQVRKVIATARIPGEIGGPGFAVTIALRNRARKAISAGSVVVNVIDHKKHPLSMLETDTKPIPQRIAARTAARGTYVFHIPHGFANPLTISVSYNAANPVVLFTGSAG